MGNGVTVKNTASVSQRDVVDSLTKQLAKANERVRELEKRSSPLLETDDGLHSKESCDAAMIGQLRNQLAKANERVKELELHANSIADALGFNAENNNRFSTSVICTNIRNLHSFSDCLSHIENAFLVAESEKDEFGETSEDVAFSKWGLTPHEYCIEFGKWLNKFAIEQQIEGIESSIAYAEGKSHFVDVSDLQDYIEQLRKEQK